MNYITANAQAILAGGALLIMGALGCIMAFVPIPAVNATSLTFILGALAGALTVSATPKSTTTTTTPAVAP